VTAARDATQGEVRLDRPADWIISPAAQSFMLAHAGDKVAVTFRVTAPARDSSATLAAGAEVAGARYFTDRFTITYAHLPVQLLQRPADTHIVALEIQTKGKRVGYLPGAGDGTAESLGQLGYEVTMLSGADLTPEKLSGLDAVVIGVRAFNERADLADAFPGLMRWVEAGGTVITQYNRPNNLKAAVLGPYPLSIEGPAPLLRVTDENAAVGFAAPEHPALNTPNKITAADFEGWVQERGLYFAGTWDGRYRTPLSMNDPGEAPLQGSLLVARHGKGTFVYTGLSFFRQLPAGVPGAYRLLANLLAAHGT